MYFLNNSCEDSTHPLFSTSVEITRSSFKQEKQQFKLVEKNKCGADTTLNAEGKENTRILWHIQLDFQKQILSFIFSFGKSQAICQKLI